MVRFHHEHSEHLESEERRKITDPAVVLRGLPLEGRILDFGAGTGFWARPLADIPAVGEVVAADASEVMLAKLRDRTPPEGNWHKIKPVTVPETGPLPFADAYFDAVFVANVLHEVPDLGGLLSEFWRILKPGGEMIVVDWSPRPSPMGPPLSERLDPSRLRQLAADAAFRLRHEGEAGPYHYLVVFYKA